MHKQANWGRASIRKPVSSTLFYTAVAKDLGPFLQVDMGDLYKIILDQPEELRAYVSSHLALSERNLALGGVQTYIAWRHFDALLKKNVDFHAKTEKDRKAAALQKFLRTENSCKIANKRISHYRRRWTRSGTNGEVLERAALIAQEILGPLDIVSRTAMSNLAMFGSGVTFSSTEPEHRNLVYKIGGLQSVTEGALPHLISYASVNDHWIDFLVNCRRGFKVVRGNRVTFVPKDWDIERTIAVEPSLNVFFQKGVDEYLKRRFRNYGITLRNQERNQKIAKIGSMTGEYATVDLSSASDTVAIEAVRWLLPPAWFELVDSLRCHEYTLDKGKSWHRYEKFSSMGNATTFPLESLLFYSVAKACLEYVGGDTSALRVYGDDIVIDRRAYLLLIEVLAFLGFKVNTQKSFAFGPFRETCGADFVNGINIRPVYTRHLPRSVPEVYNLYNRLLLHTLIPMPSTLQYLSSLVHRPHKGPWYQGMGETWKWEPGLNTVYDQYMISEPPDSGWKYNSDYQALEVKYSCLQVYQKPLKPQVDEYVRYLAFLLGVPRGEPRSSVKFKYSQRVVSTTYWPRLDYVRAWRRKRMLLGES